MELEAFAQYSRFPEGFKLHEWVPGCTAAPKVNELGNTYYDVSICAVERISDKAISTFEVFCLPGTPGVVLLDLSLLLDAVKKAIDELS